jgi:hypothetical protein
MFSGLRRIAMRLDCGDACRISSSHFGISASNSVDEPVTLPPGCARLATTPAATGSPSTDMTTGIVRVAPLAALVDGMHVVTIALGLRLMTDAASCGNA